MKDLHSNLHIPRGGSLVLGLKIATIVAAVLAIFHRNLAIIANDALQVEPMSYILTIPFMFAYLIYRKRKMLRAVIPGETQNQPNETRHLPTIVGILLSTSAALPYFYGPGALEYSILALPIFAAGLILIVFNYQTLKQLAFPIAFLLSLIPPQSQILDGVGFTLSVVGAEASNTIINALGIRSTLSSEYGKPVIQIQRADGATIPFVLDIGWSGIYSLIGFAIFAIFIVYIIRDNLGKRAAIFPIGLYLVYLLNVAKITIILLIGYHYGQEAALQIFHLLGGWVLIFLGIMLFLTMTKEILKARLFVKTKAFTQCQHYTKRTNNPQNSCSSCGRLVKYPEVQLKRRDVAKMMIIAVGVALLLRASAIAQFWQPTKTWTQVAILTSQNGERLIAMTSGLLMLAIMLYVRETRTERKMNAATYQKLSKLDKCLIDTIRETEKTTTPTLNAITTQYQSITGETIDKEKLFQKLQGAEKTRIIKSYIVNQYDEPTQIWKTQIDFKTRIPFGSVMILILLLAGVLMNAISLFFFALLDKVVNKDLYRYGLQFNYEWAGQYWAYSGLIVNLLTVAIIVTGISMAFILIPLRARKVYSAKFPSLLLAIGIVTTSLCAFSFNRLDYVIQNDLYRYGLQFSYEWAGQYWIYARFILGLLGVGIATSGISIVLILTGMPPPELDRAQLSSYSLFSAGVIALACSVYYNSSIIAFIGLGLVLWSAILFYMRPEKYVNETLFDKTTLSSLASLDQILRELGYRGKGVYLPPKYFNDFESSKVYFNAQEHTKLPSPEQMQVQGDRMFVKDPEGILITPLGVELTQLFEETLGTSFARVDLRYFEKNMTRLLIEDLEIAKNVKIETKSSRVHIRIESSIYKNICREARKFSNICNSLGCPLCSAIACALAKATGVPLIIEKDLTTEDGQTIDIEYRLLEEPKQ